MAVFKLMLTDPRNSDNPGSSADVSPGKDFAPVVVKVGVSGSKS